MKKGLKSVCAIAVASSILLATLTACGKKMDRNNSASSADTQTTAVDINNNGSYDSQTSANPDVTPDLSSPIGSSGGSSSGSSGGYSGYSGGSSSSGSSGGSSGNSSDPVINPVTNPDNNSGTDTPTETEPSTTRYVYDIKEIINNAPLNPMRTNDADLDSRIDEIFAKVITDDMTTYEKTRALFDYLVQTNEYGYLVAIGTETSYVSVYDVDVVTRAKTILKYKRGTCIDFAAAFMCLTRRIGLNCYMVQGKITDLTGKTYHHGWNTIRVNGIDYTFDSQADFRVRQRDENGKTKFVNFGTYYPDVFRVEYINLAEKSFKKFRTF